MEDEGEQHETHYRAWMAMRSVVFAMVMLVVLGATIVWARMTPEILHPIAEGSIAPVDGSESFARQRGYASEGSLAGDGDAHGRDAAGAGMQTDRAGNAGSDAAGAMDEGLAPSTRTAAANADVVDLVLDRADAGGTAEPARDGTDLWTSERGAADLLRQGSPMREGGTSGNDAARQAEGRATPANTEADMRNGQGDHWPDEAALATDVREETLRSGAGEHAHDAQNGVASIRSRTRPAVPANVGSGDAGGQAVMAGGETSSTDDASGEAKLLAEAARKSDARPPEMNVGERADVTVRDDRSARDVARAGPAVADDAAVRVQGTRAAGASANDRTSNGAFGMPGSRASSGAGEAQPPGPGFTRPRLSGIDMTGAAQTSSESGREFVSLRAETARTSDGLAEPLILAPPAPARLSDRVAQDFADDVERGVAAYRAGDYEAAARLWRPAAEADVAKAQFHMGGMTLEGRLAAPDPLGAYLWLDRAYTNGFSAAEPLLRAAERALRPADRTALEALLGRAVDRES